MRTKRWAAPDRDTQNHGPAVHRQNATQALPQEWWASTFAEAIALIGHTVMLL
eukprot:COSAG01_NODE_67782_length_266_cov_0.604790_1_plen_52_part_01